MAGVFDPAYDYVDGQLDQFLNQRLSDVIAEIDGPLRAAILLYVVLYGLAVLRGMINEPIMEGVGRMIKLAFVYTVTTTVAYSDWVTDPLFHDLPNSLARAISGGNVQTIGQAFDDFLGRGFDLAESCSKSANMVDPLPWIVALLIYGVTSIAAGLGFGITMLAKVALALLVAVGPIFIACIPFEATRKYFWGWVSQGVNYLLVFSLITAVFQLVLALVQNQWGAITSQPDPKVAGLLFSVYSVLAAIFFLQVPNIATGIAGGATAGLRDFGRSGSWAHRAASRVSTPALPRWGGRSGGSVSRGSSTGSRRAA